MVFTNDDKVLSFETRTSLLKNWINFLTSSSSS